MSAPPSRGNSPDDLASEPPSKSERKRTAHAAQSLGETLIGLRDRELDALDLPPLLLDAIREARRIRSRPAAVRQRQYIGKLMRQVDPEPIRRALAAHGERRGQRWRGRRQP